MHDHPTARQRLGDSEAGLGSAATLTIADANAIRKMDGVQYVSEGIHENVHAVNAAGTRWFTRVHGDDTVTPEIRRAWVFPHGRFFSAGEEKDNDQVVVLGAIAAKQLFGDKNPVGETISLWKQNFKVVGVVSSSSWLSTPQEGDDQFDAVYVPVTTMQKLLNLSKLNDITVTTVSTGDVTRVEKGHHERCCASGMASVRPSPTTSPSPVRPARPSPAAACGRRSRTRSPATSPGSRKSRSISSARASSAPAAP